MPVKIRGNDYMTVAERVTEAHTAGGFSMLESFPVLEGEHPYWRTIILVGERQFIGTAQIKFGARPGTADGDSPLECAETSALGRALGYAGFGVVDGIASADEMARVTTDDPLLPTRPALRELEPAAPLPMRPAKPLKVLWSSLHLRAKTRGFVTTEEDWGDVLCQVTGKNTTDTARLTKDDYEKVLLYFTGLATTQDKRQAAPGDLRGLRVPAVRP